LRGRFSEPLEGSLVEEKFVAAKADAGAPNEKVGPLNMALAVTWNLEAAWKTL
jgi:hypothetical protein